MLYNSSMELIDQQCLIDLCRESTVTLGLYKDNSDHKWLSILKDNKHILILDDKSLTFLSILNGIINNAKVIVCWDSRDLIEMGARESVYNRIIYDVRLLYGGNEKLKQLTKDKLIDSYHNLSEYENRFAANIKAAKSSGINLDIHSIMRIVPRLLVCGLLTARLNATRRLYELRHRDDLGDYEHILWPYAKALMRIESNSIHVDKKYLNSIYNNANNKLTQSENNFIKSMLLKIDGDYIRTELNPCGGKTGRIRVSSGFNCMGIPHGQIRKSLTSRYNGGKICVLDFNAIDYRCIVQSVDDDDFRRLYAGADDFHTRTTELLFGKNNVNDLRRKIIKAFTYVYAYGGSESTLSAKTGLSIAKVRSIIIRLNNILGPISLLKNKLCDDVRMNGYILRPDGMRIYAEMDDHPGKILGLFAQGFSSYVFTSALMAVEKIMQNRRSKIIFTVHDEIVIDLHREDNLLIPGVITHAMENSIGKYEFKVKSRNGSNYSEATS